ncbi:MAG: hypothetical protein ACOY3L_16710 [Pseudomonadota bacterium]
MSGREIGALYGARIERLEPPIEYGKAYADRVMRDVDLAGFAYRALFQLDVKTRRLVQVLLERRRLPNAPAAHEAALAALTQAYGPPTLVCDSPRTGAAASAIQRERVWRLPTTSIHLVYLDIGGGEMQEDWRMLPPDPLVPELERRLRGAGAYPKSLLVRFHPSDRRELFTPGCGR